MEKKQKTKLTDVVAIAMVLTIAFSGVALASQPVPPTKETEVLNITTNIICVGSVVESQRLGLEIDSTNLLDNTPLADGEIYGDIKYDEKMIGSSGTTTFDKSFVVNTSKTAPNLNVSKEIGYTAGFLGSLRHHEQVGMKAIAAGKGATPGHREDVICPFDKGEWVPGKPAVPGNCEEVHAYSDLFVTSVLATTMTEVGITKAPVNLNYDVTAIGTGLVVAGVDLYVEEGRGANGLGSRMAYKEKSFAYGNFGFTKDIGYESIDP